MGEPARALKLTTPRYQEIAAAAIPTAQTADGHARVRVVAGEALGARAVIDTHTPIVYQDWSLAPEGDVDGGGGTGDHRALAYVFEGSVLDRRARRRAASSPTARWRCWARATAFACAARPGGGRLLLLAACR